MKRSKANRKAMQAYTTTFGFRTPYQVLGEEIYPLRFVLALRGADAEGRMNGQTVDADFVLKCASQKIEVLERLATVLGGKVKPSEGLTSQNQCRADWPLGSDQPMQYRGAV